MFELMGVLLDLSSVVIDIGRVFVNVGGILVAKSLGVFNSVLEVSRGESEGLSGDEHVCGLGNLKLVVLSSEESLSVFKVVDLVREGGQRQVGSGSIATVIIVVVVVWFWVSDGSSGDDRSGKRFHCRFKFIDYKCTTLGCFYDLILNF